MQSGRGPAGRVRTERLPVAGWRTGAPLLGSRRRGDEGGTAGGRRRGDRRRDAADRVCARRRRRARGRVDSAARPDSSAMFGISCPTQTVCWAVGDGAGGGVVAEILNGVPQAASTVSGTAASMGSRVRTPCTASPSGTRGRWPGRSWSSTAESRRHRRRSPRSATGCTPSRARPLRTCIAVGRSTYPGGIGDVLAHRRRRRRRRAAGPEHERARGDRLLRDQMTAPRSATC